MYMHVDEKVQKWEPKAGVNVSCTVLQYYECDVFQKF